jgi:hypothetical protein
VNDDIYAPPKSDPTPDAPLQQESAGFHVVSPRKFWILFLSTTGLYQIYWFYSHWAAQKKFRGESTWPGMRALFSIFFTHSLFQRIRAANDLKTAPLLGFATCYVLLTVAETTASRLSINDVGSPWSDLVEFGVMPLVGYCLVSAQKQANSACGDPGGSTNNRLTAANIVWILIGLLFWGMGLFGLLVAFGVVPSQPT